VGFVSLNEAVIARARGLYEESGMLFGDYLK
jgi:hypothetical protein